MVRYAVGETVLDIGCAQIPNPYITGRRVVGFDLDDMPVAPPYTEFVRGDVYRIGELLAADKGVSGIIVSNHGGKFLPGIADPITVLPAISEALNGRIPVLIDGGIRRGADVLKALALGATAALIARPALWALTAYGAEGVQKLIELLQTELASDMTMLGTITPADVTRNHVKIHRR